MAATMALAAWWMGPPAAADAGSAASGPLRAEAAAIEAQGDRATVTVTFSSPAAFDRPPQAFALADPPRVVIDLPLVDWRIPAPPAGAGLLSGLRYGLAAPGRSRLVADLAAPATVAALRIAPTGDGGATLTLRLRGATPDGPEQAAATGALARPGGGGPRALVFAIDPGHGGADPGALRGGVREKDVTLAFARALAEALVTRGAQPMLTREEDVFVSLAARIGMARASGADALVSLHADAAPRGALSGASVYVLSATATDDLAHALAEGADAAEAAALAELPGVGSDVAAFMADMALRGAAEASERLGAALVSALAQSGPVLPSRPLRAADFRVLRAPDLPAALVELGFLTSAEDRARLTDPGWRRAAAAAMADALIAWAASEIAASAATP
jgi:N-acetylmuramoyl-L-alanine amidase